MKKLRFEVRVARIKRKPKIRLVDSWKIVRCKRNIYETRMTLYETWMNDELQLNLW